MSTAKILIADDGLVIRTVVSRKLTEAGYEVATACNGQEAIDKINSEPFDLLLLDIYMPVLNGIEALRQLRQSYTQIQLPVIMATAKDEEAQVVSCFDDGANDFVAKPINFPILFARIETQLKLKRATEELERLK
ncbi:MAG: response regulator [Verrucomicrobiales bacterium]|nr:response regulator [Verrucomicrobiales bacterium]